MTPSGRLLARVHLDWVREAALSASLGQALRDKLRLGLFHARVAVAGAARRDPPPPVTARLRPDGHEVTITEPGELAVLHGILISEEYASQGDPRTILDIGANVGFASLYFSRRHPSARIGAVEADPRTFERLRRNAAGLSRVSILNCAVSDIDGTLTFYASPHSISSSVRRRSPKDHAVKVRAMTVGALMDHFEMDRVGLLKMDIEGAEFDALAVAPMDRVDEVIVEVHYDLGDGDEALVRRLLAGFDLRFMPIGSDGRFLVHGLRAR
jgi:FkbM family methyltransferase